MVPPFVLAARALVLTLLWFLSPSELPAQAQGQTVFGPVQFERTTGPPDLFTETFILPTNIGPPFQLHIDNGLTDGSKRVSSARLTLNGVEVVRPSEFSQQVAAIDKEVVLQTGTNTLQVRLTSKPGSLLTVTITGTVTVTITDPPDGSTVTTNSVLVRGTVEADGEEVGVTVNGFAAAVQGNTFAFLLPVTPGAITITAVATTAAGATASESVEITVATPPTPTLTLHASPASGVAPLTVVFALLGAPVPTAIDLDLDGDGAVDFSGPTLEGQTFIYPQPGLFFPTVTVTDSQGNQFTGSTLVQVDDEAAIDALLQAKWTGMKDALGAGDIPLALTHIAFRSRPRYDEAFRAIEARLPDIDTILTNVTLVEVRNGVATYEATRTDVGVEKLFDIRFVIDEDGIWRIEAF